MHSSLWTLHAASRPCTPPPTHAQDIFFGGGNLADLLPDVQLEQQLGDELDGDEEEPGDRLAGSGHGRAAGSLRGLVGSDGRGSGRLTPYSSSQFPLLEETEPDGTQAGGAAPDQLSHTTRVALRCAGERACWLWRRKVCGRRLLARGNQANPPCLLRRAGCACGPTTRRSIFDERLRRAAQEQAAAAGGGAGVAEPHVSFFGLLKEGQLSRNQAATLFYQTCGECRRCRRCSARGAWQHGGVVGWRGALASRLALPPACVCCAPLCLISPRTVTTTAGFIRVAQDRPFGDILIQAGHRPAAV